LNQYNKITSLGVAIFLTFFKKYEIMQTDSKPLIASGNERAEK